MAEFDDFFGVDRQQAATSAVFALDDNPDDAARAKELGETSGVDSALIYPNVVQFEGQQKARVVNGLFNQNRFLREYVNSDPLAAKVSNDDWGQLDVISHAVTKHNADSMLVQAFKGFEEGFGAGGLGASWIKAEDIEKHPLASATYSVLGAPVEGLLRFGSGAITAVARAGEAGARQAGVDPVIAKQYADHFIQASGDPGLWASLGGLGETIGAPFMMAAHNAALREATRIEPWARKGKVPPPGVSSIIDALHVEQAKLDAENLQEALKESVKSTTRERSPDLYSKFMEQVVGDQQIGVSADAVKALYGDKVPTPDDGILGWVPRIQEQLQTAEAVGGDIKVPLADWLAKVEPEVAKQLNDHVRVRSEGLTVEEAKQPIPVSVKEDIKSPAIVFNDKLYEGINHAEALEKAAIEFGVDIANIHTKVDDTKKTQLDAFTTTQGRVISSEEAASLLNLKEKRLDSLDLSVEAARDAAALRPLEPTPEATTKAKQLSLDLPDTTPLDQREAFEKASAIGMTVEQYGRYQKRIEERARADADAAVKRTVAAERKRQSAEWKDNRNNMRAEVIDDLYARPDVAADRMMREGRLGEASVGEPKIATEFLTDEQKALLPKKYYAAKGETPAQLAELVGLPDGDAFVKTLIDFEGQRQQTGLGPGEYRRRLIESELDRRMEERYGKLDENILEQAKEQVLSETQIELLHEETLALAAQAGLEFSITKEGLQKALREAFDNLTVKQVSSDRFLADAGKAGRAAEMALLKGEPAEAFRQKQRQYNAIVAARLAKELENDHAALDKTSKPYLARNVDPNKVDPAGRFYIQGLLQQAGYKVKLTPDEIAREIEAQGHGSLGSFASHKQDFGWEPTVADWIAQRGAKPIDEMTTAEFRDFKDAIDSLNYIAREEQKIELAGVKRDFAEFKKEVIDNLKERPARPIEDLEKGGKWLYRLDAPMTRMEEIVKDIDLREELGPLYKALIVPFEQSKAKTYSMLRDLTSEFKNIDGFNRKWQRSLEDAIPNDFVFDTYNQTMFKMTRWNMVKMMLNWGNVSNMGKLVDGIVMAANEGRKPTAEQRVLAQAKIESMFQRYATKEDWTFVQKIWDLFEGYRKEVEVLERNMGGRVPKWIESRKVETPHGTFEGGYFPLMPDRHRNPAMRFGAEAPDTSGPLGRDYFRATTNQSYLESRSGAKYFVDITNGPEQLVGRLQQVIHDLSFRDFVRQAGKVIYDPEMKAAIRKHYGPEYEAQMEPWLKRIANMATTNEAELQGFNDILSRVRMNLIAAALPLNYTVMLSPSVGALNPAAIVRFNADRAANVMLVMGQSKEIPNLLYSLDRDINNALRTQLGKQGWTSFQLHAMETMFKPLIWAEQQFRMVTFYDKFTAEKAKGRTDFEAATLADSLVRERHSASHTGDLPALLASKSEFVKMSTVFMGFFSAQRNWLRQVPEAMRQGDYATAAKAVWGTLGVATMFNAALFTKRKQDEGFFHWMSRAVASTPLMMIPWIRDLWNYSTEGFQPTSPIVGMLTGVYELGRDGYNKYQGKKVKNPVKHTLNALGTTVGLPGAMQIGRTGEFLVDTANKEQRPRDIIEWMRGITTGEAQLRRR